MTEKVLSALCSPAYSQGFSVDRAAADSSRIFDYDRQWLVWTLVLLALDALTVWASLTLAFTLRISSGLLAYSAPYDAGAYRALALVSAPIWLALFAALGLYRRDNLMGGLVEYQQALRACTAGVIALIVASFMRGDLVVVSRGWLLLSWALACGLVVLGRFLARRVAYGLRQRGWFTARVLIVGANDHGAAIARQWAGSRSSGMQVVGFVDDFKPLGAPVFNGLQVIGRPTALKELAHQVGAREVVVMPNAVAWETFEEIIASASMSNGYLVRVSPGFYEMLTSGVAVTNKTFVPLFTVDQARIVGIDAALKTALDYGLGILLLVLTAPLLGLIALGLKLGRRRERILARHRTIGQGGVTFTMFKFNTQAPPSARLERFLYHTGLDKLPQLFNVLAGHMSLVGPRPRVVGNEEKDLCKVHNLQSVRPGVIGPWMVSGHWKSPDELRDELYYVRNWTIWLDLQILFQSALPLLLAERAALRGSERDVE